MLGDLFKGPRRARERAAGRAVVEGLYAEIVRRARQPQAYLAWGVPDTLDGRFDMLVLHAYPVYRRLGALAHEQAETAGVAPHETEAAGLSQSLFDHMLRDWDSNLREAGVSDMRIGSRMKKLGRAFYGRVATYDEALAAPDETLLHEALDRNVYQKVAAPPEGLAALANHARALVAVGDHWTWADLAHGVARFPSMTNASSRQTDGAEA